MADFDWKEIDSRFGSIATLIADHFSGMKSQTAHNTGAIIQKLDSLEKKLDEIIKLLEKKR